LPRNQTGKLTQQAMGELSSGNVASVSK
jgi:hypothetical protein